MGVKEAVQEVLDHPIESPDSPGSMPLRLSRIEYAIRTLAGFIEQYHKDNKELLDKTVTYDRVLYGNDKERGLVRRVEDLEENRKKQDNWLNKAWGSFEKVWAPLTVGLLLWIITHK